MAQIIEILKQILPAFLEMFKDKNIVKNIKKVLPGEFIEVDFQPAFRSAWIFELGKGFH